MSPRGKNRQNLPPCQTDVSWNLVCFLKWNVGFQILSTISFQSKWETNNSQAPTSFFHSKEEEFSPCCFSVLSQLSSPWNTCTSGTRNSRDLHAGLGHKFNHFHSVPHRVLIPCVEMTVLLWAPKEKTDSYSVLVGRCERRVWDQES